MIRSIRAELVKLTRPRFVAIALVATTLFAIGMTAVGVLLAEPAGGPPGDVALLPIEALADAGGGTAVFAQTAGFGAVFLLAVFIATVAGELTRGTFRTMLLQQPPAAECWRASSSPSSASPRHWRWSPRPSVG